MKDLKERLKDIMIQEGLSDAKCASGIGLNIGTFVAYFYGNERKARQKTLRIVERYVLAREKENHG